MPKKKAGFTASFFAGWLFAYIFSSKTNPVRPRVQRLAHRRQNGCNQGGLGKQPNGMTKPSRLHGQSSTTTTTLEEEYYSSMFWSSPSYPLGSDSAKMCQR